MGFVVGSKEREIVKHLFIDSLKLNAVIAKNAVKKALIDFLELILTLFFNHKPLN